MCESLHNYNFVITDGLANDTLKSLLALCKLMYQRSFKDSQSTAVTVIIFFCHNAPLPAFKRSRRLNHLFSTVKSAEIPLRNGIISFTVHTFCSNCRNAKVSSVSKKNLIFVKRQRSVE